MYHQSSQNSLLAQPLPPEQHYHDFSVGYQSMYTITPDRQPQGIQLQQLQQIQQLQLQQLQQEQDELEKQQQEHFLAMEQRQSVMDLSTQDPFAFDPSSMPLFAPSMTLSDPSLVGDTSGMSLSNDISQGLGNDWTSYLSMGQFGDATNSVDIDQLPMVSNDSTTDKWSSGQGAGVFSFHVQDTSPSLLQTNPPQTPQSQSEQQHPQQQLATQQQQQQLQQQQLQQQQLQQQRLQQEQQLQLQQQQIQQLQQQQQLQLQQQQQLEHQQQQHRLYQLQQQQQLRIQLELASQTQLPQSPGIGMAYSPSPLHQQQYSHQFLGMNQFPSGHSPAQSPLSPGNSAGDDYFSLRQASPGPASSPSASSKIKSRPRPSTTGTRISQGGIKALFGQNGSKTNRASLDLKSEQPHHTSAQGLTATLMAANQTANGANPPKTPPLRKKKAVKAVSAEIPIIHQLSSSTTQADNQSDSNLQESLQTPQSPSSPLPVLTLAERRAAAAAAGTQRRRSSSESSTTLAQNSGSALPAIPMSLGLDTKAKRIILPPNLTPGSESVPLSSPSILSTSATSPAPIQIDRILTRHSMSQAKTEEQQRLMDAAMERVDFDDVTVAELKEMLRQRGKHGGGKKADLIKRLQSEIDIIRANRQSQLQPGARPTGASIPPPLGSPTHSLYKTLGGMHIGTPPIHVGASQPSSSHSNLRFSVYNEQPTSGQATPITPGQNDK
ncbi:hypothetical protein FBU30_008027 [Linnemannia zychae]|nr:hypothetical protein FBU30_008027 [Linnemannia zychae]